MYWKFIENFVGGSYILLQTSTGYFSIDLGLLQILVGVIIGLVPGFITAFISKRRWVEGEKAVVGSQASLNQTQAIENIAQAATMITSQAQVLNEKSAALISVLEAEVKRQKDVIEQEREMYGVLETQYKDEVEKLKIEIAQIREHIMFCSAQLKAIIEDLRLGNTISDESLERMEKIISSVYN